MVDEPELDPDENHLSAGSFDELTMSENGEYDNDSVPDNDEFLDNDQGSNNSTIVSSDN
jgi:hypothetical protein